MISLRKMAYLSFSQTKKILQNFTIGSVLPGICICGSDANHVLFFPQIYYILWWSYNVSSNTQAMIFFS